MRSSGIRRMKLSKCWAMRFKVRPNIAKPTRVRTEKLSENTFICGTARLITAKKTVMTNDTAMIGAAIIANAAICGVLSGPFARYEARLIWLVPAVALLGGCAQTMAASRRGLTAVRAADLAIGPAAIR